VNGKKVRRKEQVKEVISIATVRDAFSKRFQTTGIPAIPGNVNVACNIESTAIITIRLKVNAKSAIKLTSMFTAILGSRMLVNWIYGGRRISKLSI
jgi:hypothetical protein